MVKWLLQVSDEKAFYVGTILIKEYQNAIKYDVIDIFGLKYIIDAVCQEMKCASQFSGNSKTQQQHTQS